MKNLFIPIVCILAVVSCVSASFPLAGNNKKDLKVEFFAIDPDTFKKAESLGFAECKSGKINVQVTDGKLREIFNKKFCTMTGGYDKKRRIFGDRLVCYEPGTFEHLQAIAAEALRLGYLSEEK